MEKEKRPLYHDLEKKLAEAETRLAGLSNQIDALKSERDVALLGSRELEEAYIESEQNFRNSLDACPLGVRIVTVEGELVYANQAMLDIYGYNTFEELKNVPREKLLTPESATLQEERMRQRRRGEPLSPEYEISIPRSDGQVRILHALRRDVIWGGEKHNMAMYQDITERKRNEEALKVREELFVTAFNTSPNLMTITTASEGRLIEVNEAFCRVTGYKCEEVIGHTTLELGLWNEPEQRNAITRKLKETGAVTDIEVQLRTKSGKTRAVIISMSEITFKNEPCLISIGLDVTERQRLEEDLEKERQEIKTIIDSSPILVFYKDKEGKFLRVNKAFAQALNMLEEDFKGKTVFDLYSLEIAQGMADDDLEVLESGCAKLNIIEQYESASGLRWVQTDKVPIFDKNGIAIGLIGFALDITERMQAEEALRESEKKFSSLFYHSPVACSLTRLRDTTIIEINDSYTRTTGFTRQDVIGRSLSEFNVWVNSLDREKMAKVVNEKGRITNEEYSMRFKSGEIHRIMLSTEKINVGGEDCVLAMSIDVTARKQLEEALRFSDAAFKSIHEAIIAVDIENKITYWNKISEELFGVIASDAIGKKLSNIIVPVESYPGHDKELFLKLIKQGYNREELCYKTPRGQVWVDMTIQIIEKDNQKYGYVMTALDISGRKHTEKSLHDSEEKFSKVFRTSGNAISITSIQDNKFMEINDSHTRFTGYNRQEIIGHTAVELKLWVYQEEFDRFLSILEKEGKIQNYEIRSRMKSGEIRVGLASAEVINIGEKPCRIVVITDITELKKAEEKHHTILKTAQDGFFIADEKGNLLEVNDSFCRMSGYAREELLKMSIPDFDVTFSQEGAERNNTIMRQGPCVFETRHKCKDGRIIDVEVSANFLDVGKGHTFVFLRDITERKRADEALRKSEENFRHSLDDSPLGIRIEDSNGETIYVNKALLDIWGYTSIDEYKSISRKERYTHESYLEYLDRMERRKHGEQVPFHIEASIIRKDGSVCHLELFRKEVLWNGVKQYQITHQDITERKNAAEAIAESEEKFNKAFKTSTSLMAISTFKEGRILDVNQAYCSVLGHKREELIGKTALELDIWVNPEHRKEYYRRLSDENGVHELEVELRTKSGEIRTFIMSSEIITLRGEVCMVSEAFDITERKLAEGKISHLNLTLRSIRNINQLITREKTREQLIQGVCNILVESRSCYSAWIALFDDSRKLTYWAENGLGSKFTPMVELLNQGKLPPCVQKAIKNKRVIITPEPIKLCSGCPMIPEMQGRGTITVRLEYGGRFYGVLSASMGKILLSEKDEAELFKEVASDIAFSLHDIELGTERDMLIQERLRAAKLQSIGTLAGGIAHDFNNLLTGIMGNISLSKNFLKPNDKAYEMLEEAEKAAVRAKDLTQQLLTFARGGKPVKKLVKITGLIKESASFALRGSNVNLELSLPDDLWPVSVDEGQIGQVLYNLVINADEAMPAGGKLFIKASNFTVEKNSTLPLSRGNFVRIDVKDTGIGMSEENLQRIFEPYFTTKQKGSGLGLTTVYSIIKNHGGYIYAESELKKGSTFYLYLPASKKVIKTVKKTEVEHQIPMGGRVLVMDDEEIIRKMVKNMLELAGYETEMSNNGEEALAKYAQALKSGKPFTAVIMDLTIPGGMGGKEAVKKILAVDPEAKVIVSSGYTTDSIMSEYKKYGFKAVITKPYSIKQLEETLSGLEKHSKKP